MEQLDTQSDTEHFYLKYSVAGIHHLSLDRSNVHGIYVHYYDFSIAFPILTIYCLFTLFKKNPSLEIFLSHLCDARCSD